MKKVLFALMAVMAMFAFSACDKGTVETQMFDLSYDGAAVEQGEIMAYQLNYEPIFVAEIMKIAQPATETGHTYVINNSTEKKAKADMKVAFDAAAKQAQELNNKSDVKLTGLKVLLKHSTASSQSQKDFLSYTFK